MMAALLAEDIPDVWILYGTILFSCFMFSWEEYLSLRQRRVLRTVAQVPVEIREKLTQETFDKARLYNIDRSLFSTCQGFFDMIIGSVFLVYGMMPLLWSLSLTAVQRVGLSGEIWQSMVFLLYSTVVSTIISMPWSVYSTFVIEHRHGFNKQTIAFFVKDKLKSLLVSQCISLPVVAAVVYIVRVGGDFFFLYLWLFCCALILFIMTIYPECIAPLFDKYTPLPEGPLRSKIEALASRLSFPLKKIYVVEGSKRSAHSNAYFYGFFNNKRIVLFDTLLENCDDILSSSPSSVSGNKEIIEEVSAVSSEQTKDRAVEGGRKGCTDEEVVAVLCHELGHWNLSHVLKNIFITQMNLLLMFAAFSVLYRYAPLYRAFGFSASSSAAGTDALPVLPGLLIVLQHVLAPYSTLFNAIMLRVSRKFEFQADSFAKKHGYAADLRSSLLKLTSDNLGFPVYDDWYSSWHHSHPTLLQRLAALDKSD